MAGVRSGGVRIPVELLEAAPELLPLDDRSVESCGVIRGNNN
jgi:hypothetical protein